MGESGDVWEFERIGTEREKMQVEKELQDLRSRLSQVEQWKQRRDEIEKELAKVWVEGGEILGPPPYSTSDADVETREEAEPAQS
jgi:ATP-binding cassette, subfamily D (ALD), peroxisomal long-chain fatty acid import protein